MAERARKLQNYFTQPFFIAEPYTRRPAPMWASTRRCAPAVTF
jgi:F0F1-type ATP synthase beta subunit